MISKQAGRALSLITGIEHCRETDMQFWMSAVTRIVMDMDEVADERGLCFIVDMLSNVWGKLPAKSRED